jgi:phosphoribosylformylglycinamidine cyclo-ligase
MIASALGRFETIGFDCVAMNVNDILSVGAMPIAMVDYIGVHELDDEQTADILRGLGAAAREAGIAIPGGELAQLPEVIGKDHFDLVGTCIGTVHPNRMVLGRDVSPGDALIGITSSGIHSNGLTLARNVLLKRAGYRLDDVINRLGRTVGEELLQPTTIYSRAINSLRAGGTELRGLAHITSDGFANLCRLEAEVGYAIEHLPRTPEIFELIAEAGDIDAAEMFRVFNMGVGFVVVTPAPEAAAALELIHSSGHGAVRIGTVTADAGVVEILPAALRGGLRSGSSFFAS